MTRPFDKAKYNALLNGLEISEIKFSELISGNRIDAEVYEKQYVAIDKRLSRHPTALLGDITQTLRKGIFDVNASVYSDSGIPFVRISNLKNMQIQGDFVHIPEEVDRENHKTHLSKGDIVLSKTAYAAASLVTVDECNVSQDTVALKLKSDCGIRSDFLATYFNTQDGLLLLRRWFTGNIQMHLNLVDCANIAVPVFSDRLQTKVGDILKNGISKRESSESDFKTAQRTLLEAIDYVHPPTSENVSTKSFSRSFATSGRLDAEFYQPKHDELERHIRDKGNCCKLSDVASFIQRGRQPVYAASGLRVINSRHVQSGYVDLTGERYGVEPNSDDLIIRKNDVLLNGTGRGTIGRCSAYLNDKQALPDNHVTIIRSSTMDPVYLSVYLNSIAGQMQVERFYKGSSGQIELYPEDIGNFLIWNAPKDVQHSIRQAVETSLSKKEESFQCLEKAKRAVEIAIEKGEEAALAYLEGRQFMEQTVVQDLADQAPYFSIDAVRRWLADQKMTYKPDTVKTYLSRQKKAGKIFDAGKGWYSSLSEPLTLNPDSLTKITTLLSDQFPLLNVSCWSTEQINPFMHHLLSKFVTFVYTDADAMETVGDALSDAGHNVLVNPGKEEIEKFYGKTEHPVIIRASVTKEPAAISGLSPPEKLLVDLLFENNKLQIMMPSEAEDVLQKAIQAGRVNMAVLLSYAKRRRVLVNV